MKLSVIITMLFVVCIIGYGLFRANTIIFGPTATVFYPKPYSTQKQEFVLSGVVEDATYLTINDQRVYPTRNGLFEQEMLLPLGYNIVEIYALSRQKKETVIHLPLYIKEI